MSKRSALVSIALGVCLLLGIAACGNPPTAQTPAGTGGSTGGSGGGGTANPPSGPSGTGVQQLDTTFNGSGYAYRGGTAGGTYDDAFAVVLDSQQRIVAAGISQDANAGNHLAIWRYAADGRPDPTFNGSGAVTHSGAGGGWYERAFALAIDAQSRIVAAGESFVGTTAYLTLWRYNPDGTLDRTFNGSGVLTVTGTAGGTADQAFAVALDASGKLVVAGGSQDATQRRHMAVWRFNTDGSPDTTFNTTGSVTQFATAGGVADYGYAMTLDGQGRIVVAGASATSAAATLDVAVWRFNPDGTLDTSLNGTGYALHGGTAGGHFDEGYGVVIDGSGRMVVTGISSDATDNYHLAVWRFTSTGALDTSFDGAGYATTFGTAGGLYDYAYGPKVDGSGRILVPGIAGNAAGRDDMAVWRFNSDGSLDATFNGSGSVTLVGTAGGIDDVGRALVLDAQGRLIVAGSSADTNDHGQFTVWRFNP